MSAPFSSTLHALQLEKESGNHFVLFILDLPPRNSGQVGGFTSPVIVRQSSIVREHNTHHGRPSRHAQPGVWLFPDDVLFHYDVDLPKRTIFGQAISNDIRVFQNEFEFPFEYTDPNPIWILDPEPMLLSVHETVCLASGLLFTMRVGEGTICLFRL
ncbi:uncharacterized protein EI90DRAFT_3067004, partial [Cantharellus anzutake]|uniref:uncharacterized protein n=1 Tax=Cantharellus anzutake TaxID=1750568 RepID=UPI0019050279